MTADNPSSLTEPLRLSGSGPVGLLAVHGFTGSPASMQPVARTLWEKTGAPTSVPLLPGHGTSAADMARSTWDEWSEAVDRAADELRGDCDEIVLLGLSMGGALSLKAASERDDIAHLDLVNPAVFVDNPVAPLATAMSPIVRWAPGITGTINKPDEDEQAYSHVPVRSVGELYRGLGDVRSKLWMVTAPITYFLSGEDSVVAPRSWNFVRQHVGGPLRTVSLPLSNHVATLDYDRDRIESEMAAVISGLQKGTLQEGARGEA